MYSTIGFILVENKAEGCWEIIALGWSGSRVVFVDEPRQTGVLKAEQGGELCIVGSKSVVTVDSTGIKKAIFPMGRYRAEYTVGPLGVVVYGDPWPSYRWRPTVSTANINTVIEQLTTVKIHIASVANVFRQIFDSLVDMASDRLRQLGVDKWLEGTAKLCSTSALGLTPIAPLLLDDHVEEVYLDRPGALCYIDHSKYGRLWYPYVVSRNALLRLGLYTELSVSSALSYASNSVKGYIQAGGLNLRISVDSEPLAADGGACVIRKLYHAKWTLKELIRNGTLSVDAAALLVGSVVLGNSLLVCGLPRSGKTTLCNALLECLPSEWRKLYIEDVLETSVPAVDNRVVRYSTDSAFNTDKLKEVTQSLHRSPDLIFVGELQTKQQTLAAVMLMAIGVPCIQTVHATSLEGLLDRWRNIYNLEVEFKSPIMFAFMSVDGGKRSVRKMVFTSLQKETGMRYHVIYTDGAIDWAAVESSGLKNAYEIGVRTLGTLQIQV